eukprot:NODE_214_length_12495_cov_0.543078.p9 type:complete len:103 gc:universal NODE_214_length_12495_cov_0.543078:4908-5216(+)
MLLRLLRPKFLETVDLNFFVLIFGFVLYLKLFVVNFNFLNFDCRLLHLLVFNESSDICFCTFFKTSSKISFSLAFSDLNFIFLQMLFFNCYKCSLTNHFKSI